MDPGEIRAGRRDWWQSTSISIFLLAVATPLGCSGDNPTSSPGTAGSGGGGAGRGGSGGSSVAGQGGLGGQAGSGAPAVQTCVPPADKEQPPAQLSQTGCMDAERPTMMAASVLPYEVNSALWSDGADKVRGMALPVGAKIHVKNCATTPAECTDGAADDGKWVMPVGTVMVKSFVFDSKLVETRLFVRPDAATWIGYSYRWNEAQTEATVVPNQRVETAFNTGARTVTWRYPDRNDCMTCHVHTAGATLGPETAQMNRTVGGSNQLDRWGAMGLFDAPLPMPYKTALPDPLVATAGTVEQRARSYLHANCGFCHRPNDEVFPDIDLRRDIALTATKACGVAPLRGDQGVADALVIKPGQPRNSVLVLRMEAAPADMNGNHGRMPKLASYVVDEMAVSLLSSWITSIPASACPPPP